MAIVASDLPWKRSTTSGSAGNTTTQSNPQDCLGKYISTTAVPTALHCLFLQMSGSDNAALVAQYACVFIHNAHASLTLYGAKAYLSGGDPAGGATVAIAADTTAASPVDSSSAQALTAASPTAPGATITGLAFSAPSSATSGISLGDIPPGYCKAIWVRRTGANSTAATEAITLAVAGGTLA